tara:strand:- start:19 stop:444 length:426 start_codon:yes stop_codon:yes gene_type:complete
MPVAKTASKARRTRKSTTAKSKTTAASRMAAALEKQESVKVPSAVKTTYVRNSEGKMTKTVTEVDDTVTLKTRPEKPNLSLEDYKADVKVRWEIHQWETQELWKDCVWGYQQIKPVAQKVYTYCIDSYNRAFNETKQATDS